MISDDYLQCLRTFSKIEQISNYLTMSKFYKILKITHKIKKLNIKTNKN